VSAVIAIDVPVLLLAVGTGALVATMGVIGLTMPTWRRPRRRRPRPAVPWRPVGSAARPQAPIPATYRRRVVTGLPAALPPLPEDGRQPGTVADDPSVGADVRAAEQLIDDLLGSHPEEVARLMTLWISEDDR